MKIDIGSCRDNAAAKMRDYLRLKIDREADLQALAAHIGRSVRYAHSLAKEFEEFTIVGTGKLPVRCYSVRLTTP